MCLIVSGTGSPELKGRKTVVVVLILCVYMCVCVCVCVCVRAVAAMDSNNGYLAQYDAGGKRRLGRGNYSSLTQVRMTCYVLSGMLNRYTGTCTDVCRLYFWCLSHCGSFIEV